jgi:hypothetical protein
MDKMALGRQLMAYMEEGCVMAMDTIRDKQELERIWPSGQASWAHKCSKPVLKTDIL